MSIILTVLLILLGSSFFATLFNKKIEETIIFYMMSTIMLVYILGLFRHLTFGVYAFIAISIILGIVELILFIKHKNKKEFLKNIFTPGLFIFFILNIVLIYFQRGRMFGAWDEFTHWGSAVKSMFEINDFSTNPNSSLYFQSYPPAMTIFQYIFVFIKGEFIEYYTYYSYELFCLSLLLPFVSKIEWKDIMKIILYTVLIILVPTIFCQSFYRSIYVDAALGMTFGFIVSLIITKKENYTLYDIVLISLSSMVLVLQKDTGLFLAIVAILMLIIDNIVFKNKLEKQNKKAILKKCLIIIIPIVCIIITKASWNYTIEINNAIVKFSGKYDVKEIIRIILRKDESYRTTVMNNFISACFNKVIFKNIISLNIVQLGIAFSMAFIIVSKICKLKKRENIHISITIIGLLIYLFGLMITYMYKFNQTEAIGLASFERYIEIYLTGTAFVLTAILIENNNISNKIILILTLFVMMLAPLESIQQTHISTESSVTKRNDYIEDAKKIRTIVNENDKLYFLDKQNKDWGYTYWITRYLLIPTKFSSNHEFNITTTPKKADSYLVYCPFDRFKDTIFNEYDYVYINGIDDDFKNEYGSLFENLTDHSLYKVEENKLEKIY